MKIVELVIDVCTSSPHAVIAKHLPGLQVVRDSHRDQGLVRQAKLKREAGKRSQRAGTAASMPSPD
jgi:hypothetical protein